MFLALLVRGSGRRDTPLDQSGILAKPRAVGRDDGEPASEALRAHVPLHGHRAVASGERDLEDHGERVSSTRTP